MFGSSSIRLTFHIMFIYLDLFSINLRTPKGRVVATTLHTVAHHLSNLRNSFEFIIVVACCHAPSTSPRPPHLFGTSIGSRPRISCSASLELQLLLF